MSMYVMMESEFIISAKHSSCIASITTAASHNTSFLVLCYALFKKVCLALCMYVHSA
jgi:hypothetical protein